MNARNLVSTLLVPAMLALAAPAAAQFHPRAGGGPGAQAPAAAPDPARVAQHWQERAQRLALILVLDARQQQQLQAIVQAELARWQQTVAGLPPHTEQRHAARQALMQDFDARLSAILNATQRTQWDALKQEMRGRHGRHGERGGGGRGGFGHGGGAGAPDEDRLGI